MKYVLIALSLIFVTPALACEQKAAAGVTDHQVHAANASVLTPTQDKAKKD